MAVQQRVLVKHSEECWYNKRAVTGRIWVCPKVVTLDRDRTGRLNPKSRRVEFLLYRCNCPQCPAQMIVNEDIAAKFLGLW